jgi:hypothetical protein
MLVIPAPMKAQDPSIVGAWITTEWEGQEGEAQPGLLIFTDTHYSMMFVPAGKTREEWTGESMTDADMAAAFSTLVANSGRYTQTGNQVTTEAFVSLNPNYMARWGENHLTYTFRVEGNTLHLTWPEGFMEPGDPPFKGTFRRVG